MKKISWGILWIIWNFEACRCNPWRSVHLVEWMCQFLVWFQNIIIVCQHFRFKYLVKMSNLATISFFGVIKFVGSVVFSGYPVSSTNNTDRHDITEILLKVALNTINHKPLFCVFISSTMYTFWLPKKWVFFSN